MSAFTLKNALVKVLIFLIFVFLTLNSGLIFLYIYKEISTPKTVMIFGLDDKITFHPHHLPLYNNIQIENISSKVNKFTKPQITNLDLEKLNEISANSYGIYEVTTHRPIFTFNEQTPRKIASLTKLFSMFAANRVVENKDVEITLDEKSLAVEGSNYPLPENSKYSFKDLLYISLINSNNQSVSAIERYIKENYSVNLVDEMNKFGKLFYLENTKFSNTIGFDSENNYSSVNDIAKFLRIFELDEEIYKPLTIRTYKITDINTGLTEEIRNSNDLLYLGEEGVLAGKTGTTFEAGENLVLFYNSKKGESYHIIILNSSSRYKDAYNIIEFININQL